MDRNLHTIVAVQHWVMPLFVTVTPKRADFAPDQCGEYLHSAPDVPHRTTQYHSLYENDWVCLLAPKSHGESLRASAFIREQIPKIDLLYFGAFFVDFDRRANGLEMLPANSPEVARRLNSSIASGVT